MTARRTLAIVAAALLCGVGDVLLVLGSEHFPDPGVWAVFGPLAGFSFVGTGLYAWRRRLRLVPRAAARRERSGGVHVRHRARKPHGPDLRPPPPQLPDRPAGDAR